MHVKSVKDNLNLLLDELGKRIMSVEHGCGFLNKREELFKNALEYHSVPRLPVVSSWPLEDELPFQPFPQSEMYNDPAKMLYNELLKAFDQSITYNHLVGDDLPWTIRPNFGTVLVASMVGGRVEFLEESPPWVRPFEDKSQFLAALDRSPSEGLETALIQRVADTYGCYHELLEGWKELYEKIHIVLPDTQGPLDTVEQLRGSDFYIDLYEDPETSSRMLAHAAELQIALIQRLLPLTTEEGQEYTFQHGTMISGTVLLRNDSSTLISPEMYEEHIAPHDASVLKACSGGGIHACGRMEHLADSYLANPHISCIDIGQPEMNNIDLLYRKSSARQVPLIRISVPRHELLDGSVLDRFPTGVSLVYRAQSLEDAKVTMDGYLRASEKRR